MLPNEDVYLKAFVFAYFPETDFSSSPLSNNILKSDQCISAAESVKNNVAAPNYSTISFNFKNENKKRN